VSRAFAELWGRATGQPHRLGMSQRIYQLERVIPVHGVPGEPRPATPADRDMLVRWFEAFSDEAVGDTPPGWAERAVDLRLAPGAFRPLLWSHEGPVSMAGYGGPTPNGIRVGPVYTPPEHRGRGYASAVVAALSQRLLDEGRRYCFLFTDLANPTSNHIYQAVGYESVCDVDEYRFEESR
jgi:predicted GNAT family acetyltransferase